jgi:hypothetical protein
LFNEVYSYLIIAETLKQGGPFPGYWTNLQLYKAGVKLGLAPTTNLALSYQYLRAVEDPVAGLSTKMFSYDGKERGHIATMILSHAFTKSLDGYLQLEYFIPGNYYADQAEDAIFFRWQLQFKF